MDKEANPPKTRVNQNGFDRDKDKGQEYNFAQGAGNIFWAILCGIVRAEKRLFAYPTLPHFIFNTLEDFTNLVKR